MDEAERRFPTLPPQDRYNAAYLSFLTMGIGILFNWNAFVTAADYFVAVYPGHHPDRFLTICYLPINLATILWMVVSPRPPPSRLRIMAGFSLFSIVVLIATLLLLRPPSPGILYALLFMFALAGMADGLSQGALFGEAAALSPRYVQALVVGTSLSGVTASSLRVLTKAALSDSVEGLRRSSLLYFGLCAAFCLLCLGLYAWVIPSLPEVVYFRRARLAQGSVEEGAALLVSSELSASSDALSVGAPPESPAFGKKPRSASAASLRAQPSHAPSVEGLENLRPLRPIESLESLRPPRLHTHPAPAAFDLEAAAWRGPLWTLLLRRAGWACGALMLNYVITLSIFPGVLVEDSQSHSLKSWYPVLLVAVYNLGDFAGKASPTWPALRHGSQRLLAAEALARVLFLPAFYAASRAGAVPWMFALALALGLSNGHVTACSFVLAPQLNPRAHAELSANIVVLSLVAGLVLGAACSFFWLLV
ncbi:hypothetical protein H632_c579p1 [Helicosporidium sp. ATCC 50920]|nr:hypothetical protein H632_c579p1 [Helicosporidium sp. ATCC 50920]|eukprot:KDD75636.1 hypothetical protein H632_c579p1 [Helicosporidium sp. ATCC 50920]